jgi:acyl carrier protein
MSTRSSPLSTADLADSVRQIIAAVLMVEPDRLRPDSALIGELGAESIDFLDLVFRLEDAIGKKIPVTRWQQFLQKRLSDLPPEQAITVDWVQEFAEEEARGEMPAMT